MLIVIEQIVSVYCVIHEYTFLFYGHRENAVVHLSVTVICVYTIQIARTFSTFVEGSYASCWLE